MRILYFGVDGTNRGRRPLEVRVAETLANRGHDVHLVVPREPEWGPNEEQPDGLDWFVQPLREAENDPRRAAELAHASPHRDPDLVYGAGAQAAHLLAEYDEDTPKVCQLLDVPLWRIQYEGTEWDQQWRQWAEPLMTVDHLVLNHQQAVEDWTTLLNWYGHDEAEAPTTSVVYYGCDTNLIEDIPSPTLPPWSDIDWTGPVVGVLSRLTPYKGIGTAIRAISLLPEDEQPLLAILGNGRDMMRLANLSYMSGVTAIVEGDIRDEEKPGLFKALDAYVYPDYNPHVSGLTPIEATYAGTPTIVSSMPVNEQRYKGISSARYADPHDTREWAKKLRATLSMVEMRDDVVPKDDRQWVRTNRSVESHAAGLEKVFEEEAG